MLLRQRPSCARAILCSLAVLLSPVLCPRPAPGQYTTLVDSGPSSNRVDMVLMGDGYTAGEIPVYVSAAWSLVNYMFNPGPLPYVTDPYPRYANFFNVHRIDVVSNESGADRPPEGIWRDTALGASYYFDGGPDRLLYIDTALGYAALSQALQGAPFEAEVRPVIVNDSLDGGGGGYGDFAVYAGADVGPPVPPETALHELGHAFNWLDDEYVTDTLAYGGPEPGAVNVSTDPTGGKWWPWLGYDQPGVGVIGAYEGGGDWYATGLWRPSSDAKMRAFDTPFNAICREKIILDIYSLADPLDAWTPNGAPLVDPDPLFVTPLDPAVIQVAWSINGTPVSSAGSFRIEDFVGELGAGRYTIAARAYDDTPWVRGDRDLLEQTVTWDVRVTGTGLSSQWSLPSNGAWSAPDNWAGPVPNGVGAGASFLDTPAGPRTVTVDVPVTVGTLNFDNANTYTLTGSETLTMQASIGDAILNVAGGNQRRHVITAPVRLASDTSANVWSDTLTIAGDVSGPGGLTIVGAGTLVLAPPVVANTYSGRTSVYSGVLRATDEWGLPVESRLQLNGGVLEGIGEVTFSRPLGEGPGLVWWTAGGFSAFGGPMTVDIGGDQTPLVWGSTPYWITSGDMVFGSSASDNETVLLNPVELNGDRTIRVNDNPATTGDFATLAASLSNGGLTKTGPGTLVLGDPNTYTGQTVVAEGTLRYGTADAIADSSPVTVGGGTLDIGLYSDTVGVVTLNGGSIIGAGGALTTTGSFEVRSGSITATLAGGAALNKGDPYGTVVLSGLNTYTGPTRIYGGTLRANSGAGLPAASNLVLAGGVLEGIGNTTFTRALGTGPDQVQWTGSGGFSAYGGRLIVNIGGNSPADTLTWNLTAGFVPSGEALIFGSPTANAETVFLNPITLGGFLDTLYRTVIVYDNPGTSADYATLAGSIRGYRAALVKEGLGTLVLAGTNRYTRGTFVTAGTVRATAGGLGLWGAVFLEQGTTLDLVGQLGVQPGLVADFYTSNFGGQGTAIMTTPGAAGWDAYTPAWTGVVPYVDFPLGAGADDGNPFRVYTEFQTDDLSARVRGYVYIPSTGTWRFHSGSDDGSKLWVRDDAGNWVTACDNDNWQGFPGSNPNGISIWLSAGYHEIAGGFYEGGWDAGWEMRWLGTDFASSPPAWAMAPYLFQVAPGGSSDFGGNDLTVEGSATVKVTGLVSMASLTLSAAATSLSVPRGLGTTNAVTFTGTSLNGNVTIDNAADVDMGPVSDGGTGAGLIKSGPGALTLGPASRSGATTLLSGTIALSASEALGSGPVTVSGGTLNIGDYSHTAGRVALTGGLLTSPGGGALATTDTFDMQSGTVRAVLVGGAPMTKTTSGTVVLTAANAYGGGTTVAEGTLRAHGGGLGTGPVVLASGTTLDLVGQMGIQPGLVADFYTSNFGGQGSTIMTTPGAAGWDPYTPAWTGVVPCADFPVGAIEADDGNPFRDYTPFQTDDLSARVRGYVYIPTSGTYRFHSGSDDGSAVWVRDDLGNWVTACGNDFWWGFPGNTPNGNPIALSAGYHEIAGGFYEGGGGAGWEMRWDAGLGTDFASSPPGSALAPYLFQVDPGGSPYFGNAVTVAGDATINVRGTAILGSLAVGEAVSTARLEVLDVDGLFVCEGLEISADCTLVKAGGGTATFEGPQTHGADALLLVEDGTVNLNTDAGSATEANLDIEVIAGTVNFGSTQHLDELRIGAEGLARITSGGSKVLVLNFLWIDTGTPLGVGGASQGVVPEPGTLSLLALGGLVLLRRRCGASS